MGRCSDPFLASDMILHASISAALILLGSSWCLCSSISHCGSPSISGPRQPSGNSTAHEPSCSRLFSSSSWMARVAARRLRYLRMKKITRLISTMPHALTAVPTPALTPGLVSVALLAAGGSGDPDGSLPLRAKALDEDWAPAEPEAGVDKVRTTLAPPVLQVGSPMNPTNEDCADAEN